MSFLRREITPHGFDALCLFYVGWSLVDLSAVPSAYTESSATNGMIRAVLYVAGVGGIILAVIQWRRGARRARASVDLNDGERPDSAEEPPDRRTGSEIVE